MIFRNFVGLGARGRVCVPVTDLVYCSLVRFQSGPILFSSYISVSSNWNLKILCVCIFFFFIVVSGLGRLQGDSLCIPSSAVL